MTKEQVKKKYKGKYIEFNRTYNYGKQEYDYEIIKTSKKIRENMTLGEDIETNLEYRR